MRTKRLTEILGRLVDKTLISTDKITDFTPGSAVRSIYEAISLELEQFYVLTKENIEWGIQEGIMEAFDFTKQQQVRAYGDVTIKFYNPLEQDYYIPKGTTFTSTRQQYPQQFETLVDYFVKQGSTSAVLEVYCKEPGIVGNVPEHVINVMSSSATIVKSVSNETSFFTGLEEETQESLKHRFHMFLESIGRATNKAITYATLKVPNIAGVYVSEDIGKITVYAHDNNGNLSNSLAIDVEQSVEEYRPSGIYLEVKPVEKVKTDISATVTVKNKSRITVELEEHIESVIRDYFNNFGVSDNIIITDLIQVIMNIDDSLIYDVSFENLKGNIITNPEQIIRPGTIDVELI